MPERFAIVAFSDRSRTAAEEYAALTGLSLVDCAEDYHDLLRRDDVEAVVVAVPIPYLRRVAQDCLEAGKHLICEKPPGASEEEAFLFAALVNRFPGQKTLMAEQFFYRDECRLARQMIDAGAVGQVRLVLSRVARQELPLPGTFASTPWRSKPVYPGGSILDGGIHSLAEFRFLGGDVTSLFARTERLNPTIDAPSVLAMTARFANGGTGDFVYGSCALPVVDEVNGTRVYGTEGNLVVSWGKLKRVNADGSVEEYTFSPSNGYFNEFVNFYDAIAHGAPIVGTVDQSVRNMLVLLRAFDSSEDGRPRDLSDASWNRPATGVPLWRPHGATGLFDGLPLEVTHTTL
jgi:predicted dehydrogenase